MLCRKPHSYIYIYIYCVALKKLPCAPKPGLVRHRSCAAYGCGLCGRLVRHKPRVGLCGMVFLTVFLILFWLVRRLMRHKPVAYGRPAYGAQAAAQAICSTKLLVRLMVRPGFTARTACAGLCGNFCRWKFYSAQHSIILLHYYDMILIECYVIFTRAHAILVDCP